MSVDPDIGDKHSNEAAIGNGPAGASLPGSSPGTPFSTPRRRTSRAQRHCASASNGHRTTWKETAEAAWGHTRELRDYGRLLLGVRADRAAHELRQRITKAAIGAAGAVVGAAALVAATTRIVSGLAGGFTQLYEGRAWLGNLTAGVVLLAVMAACGAMVLSRRKSKELEEHLAKYERIHHEHDIRHGRSAGDSETGTQPEGVPRSR